VIVVDRAWLIVASLLESLISVSGLRHAKRVVGSRMVDDVLRIQSAHHGMFDVVDLTMPTHHLVTCLQKINDGSSLLHKADLWRRVPRPTKVGNITTVPQDAIDLAIIELICIGYRDQDIAEALHYSVQAVKNRLGAMLRRSGLSNRTQLAWQFTNQVLTARMIQNMQHSEAVARATAATATSAPGA
jgi:DNA-binding NarL/FixJ family response regulator